jgi:hypothetical protein
LIRRSEGSASGRTAWGLSKARLNELLAMLQKLMLGGFNGGHLSERDDGENPNGKRRPGRSRSFEHPGLEMGQRFRSCLRATSEFRRLAVPSLPLHIAMPSFYAKRGHGLPGGLPSGIYPLLFLEVFESRYRVRTEDSINVASAETLLVKRLLNAPDLRAVRLHLVLGPRLALAVPGRICVRVLRQRRHG